MNQSPPITHLDIYRLIRSQIEFEDNLITQRLSWFVAAQSFLFTAYAINLNGPPMTSGSEVWRQHRLVFNLIPVVAMASCFLIYAGIVAGTLAQKRLRSMLHERPSAESLPELPPIHGTIRSRVGGMAAPLGLPPVFVTIWIILFISGLSV